MSSNSNSSWTTRQNKVFEEALATYKDKPEWWQNVARAVGGKSVEEVRRHYQTLLQDINHIETGKVPVSNYKSFGDSSSTITNNKGYQ